VPRTPKNLQAREAKTNATAPEQRRLSLRASDAEKFTRQDRRTVERNVRRGIAETRMTRAIFASHVPRKRSRRHGKGP